MILGPGRPFLIPVAPKLRSDQIEDETTVKPTKAKIWTMLACCMVTVTLGHPVASVGASAGPSYPTTDEPACDQYDGVFLATDDNRVCTVVAPDTARTVYTGFGAGSFAWVQTSKYPAQPFSADAELGPATVGCAKPADASTDDWTLACM